MLCTWSLLQVCSTKAQRQLPGQRRCRCWINLGGSHQGGLRRQKAQQPILAPVPRVQASTIQPKRCFSLPTIPPSSPSNSTTANPTSSRVSTTNSTSSHPPKTLPTSAFRKPPSHPIRPSTDRRSRRLCCCFELHRHPILHSFRCDLQVARLIVTPTGDVPRSIDWLPQPCHQPGWKVLSRSRLHRSMASWPHRPIRARRAERRFRQRSLQTRAERQRSRSRSPSTRRLRRSTAVQQPAEIVSAAKQQPNLNLCVT